MQVDVIPLMTGLLVFIASLISLKAGLSVAIVEIILGAITDKFFHQFFLNPRFKDKNEK